jgi:hypothetical protein
MLLFECPRLESKLGSFEVFKISWRFFLHELSGSNLTMGFFEAFEIFWRFLLLEYPQIGNDIEIFSGVGEYAYCF